MTEVMSKESGVRETKMPSSVRDSGAESAVVAMIIYFGMSINTISDPTLHLSHNVREGTL